MKSKTAERSRWIFLGTLVIYVFSFFVVQPTDPIQNSWIWDAFGKISGLWSARGVLFGLNRELSALLRNPGFLSGFFIGLLWVKSAKELPFAMVPSALAILSLAPLIPTPLGGVVVSMFYPVMVVLLFPYSLIGGIFGFVLSLLLDWHPLLRGGKKGLVFLFVLVIPSIVRAYLPEVGHKEIVGRGRILINQNSPGEYLEIERFLNEIMTGAELEDGAFDGDSFGLRGPRHFHNPETNKGLRTVIEGLMTQAPWDAINDEAVALWEEALAAYAAGNKTLAYRKLGHVAHLATGDMFQPAHVHDDPHLPHNISGDGESIETRYDEKFGLIPVSGTPFRPTPGALNKEKVIAFGNSAALTSFGKSSFEGSLAFNPSELPGDGDVVGAVYVGGSEFPIRFIEGDFLKLDPDLIVNHFVILPQNLLYDYTVQGDIGVGFPRRSQDWWEIPSNQTVTRRFYFDQFNRVFIDGQRLDDYLIFDLMPQSYRYTAGLMMAAAEAFDSVVPVVEMKPLDDPDSVIPPGGDLGYFSYLFFKNVEGIRSDVDYVPQPFLESEWGHSALHRQFGEFAPAESGLPMGRYLDKFLSGALSSRPVFFDPRTPDLTKLGLSRERLAPYGLVGRLPFREGTESPVDLTSFYVIRKTKDRHASAFSEEIDLYSAGIFMDRGDKLAKAGNLEAALRNFYLARLEFPRSHLIAFKIAAVFHLKRNPDRTRYWLRETLDLTPNFQPAIHLLAEVQAGGTHKP